MNPIELTPIEEAMLVFGDGGMVIVVDDEDRENEGDLVIGAEHATPAAINFMATHGRGLICLAMHGPLLDRLQIPMMVPELQNRSGFGTGFTVSVEAASGVSTGISAADRAETVKTLVDPRSTPADIAMPGHVFPLRARRGGVLERRGQTEAGVDLARLTGQVPAGVICEIMAPDGEMMRLPELVAFAREHALPIISIDQLATHRRALESDSPDAAGSMAVSTASVDTRQAPPAVTLVGRSKLPSAEGNFDIAVFRDTDGLEHSAVIKGEPHLGSVPPLVRLHSECLTGDAFGSLRCDCGEQLRMALQRIEQCGRGIVLYLRQEGRGIGLGNKIRAYELQDEGRDTVEANLALGFPADARHYGMAAAMLAALDVPVVRLLSNNPAKKHALTELGIEVSDMVAHVVPSQPENVGYRRTKVERMGHAAALDDSPVLR